MPWQGKARQGKAKRETRNAKKTRLQDNLDEICMCVSPHIIDRFQYPFDNGSPTGTLVVRVGEAEAKWSKAVDSMNKCGPDKPTDGDGWRKLVGHMDAVDAASKELLEALTAHSVDNVATMAYMEVLHERKGGKGQYKNCNIADDLVKKVSTPPYSMMHGVPTTGARFAEFVLKLKVLFHLN